MSRILCLGMAALDAIYRVPVIPAKPVKVIASSFSESGGGMAANTAVAVARLGGAADYWGRVGADEVGRRILRAPAGEGVDIEGAGASPGGRPRRTRSSSTRLESA